MSKSAKRVRDRRRKKEELIIRKKHLLPIALVVFGVFTLGIGAFVLLSGNPGGTPDLVVEQDVFDYGEVPFNTPVETVFVIRNDGDAPLKIREEPQVVIKDGC